MCIRDSDTTAVVKANGGQVLGSVAHPLNTQDFSSFLLQAQASRAKIIGLANAGGDTDNAVKQGAEFGIAAGGQHFAGLLVFITDVQALGLKTAQGLVLTETWYWDMTDANRAWTKRWQVERPGKFPAMTVAGVYAATLHYLKAVAALKSATDGKAVVAKMKDMPTDDPLFGKGLSLIHILWGSRLPSRSAAWSAGASPAIRQRDWLRFSTAGKRSSGAPMCKRPTSAATISLMRRAPHCQALRILPSIFCSTKLPRAGLRQSTM